MAAPSTFPSRRFLAVLSGFLLILGAAFAPRFFPPPGLNAPEPIGKFLSGNLPPITPWNGTGINWEVVPAFPNLLFDNPLVISPIPNTDSMMVATRAGLITFFEHTPTVSQLDTLLDLQNQTAFVWDGGLLGLAFHPQFGQAGHADRNYFYAFYCAVGPQGESGPLGSIPFSCENDPTWEGSYMRLSRFEVQEGTMEVIPNSEDTLFNIRLYNSSHRGGGLTFGNDGYLYLALGDQGRYTTPQNISSNFEGGVLRLDVNTNGNNRHAPIRRMGQQAGFPDEFTGNHYYIPNDNPWQDATGGLFEEFYAMGSRNPHRMTLDPQSGNLWIGDVGNGLREEVNIVAAGKNFGWPVYEGNVQGHIAACGSNTLNIAPGTYEAPVVDFTRDETNCIIGGYVYRGSTLSELSGAYICGGYAQNRLFRLDPDGNGGYTKTEFANFTPGGLITFGTDHAGELYMGKEGNNTPLYTLEAVGVGPPAPDLLSQTGAFTNLNTLEVAPGILPYSVIEPFWSDSAEKYRWISLPNNEDGNGIHDKVEEKIQFSEEGDWRFPNGTVIIKHMELGGTKVETRFVVKGDDSRYYFLSYRWNAAQTDATLQYVGQDSTIQVNGQPQVWHYPSRSECQSCHLQAAGSVLGLNTRQLNQDLLYPSSGMTGNQLETMSHLDWFDQQLNPGDLGGFLTLANKYNTGRSLEDRARSYLDVNCAYCHRPGTGNRAAFDARFSTPLAAQNLINGAVINTLDIPGARVIVPQRTDQSVLFHRVDTLEVGIAMPPLAKGVIDTAGVRLLAEWIGSLDPIDNQPLTLIGDASVLPGGCYELTPDEVAQVGAAWFPRPVDLREDIVLTFSLGLGEDDAGADGVACVFQHVGPDVLGGPGASLGTMGMAPSVGITFDTYGQQNDEIFLWQNGDMQDMLTPRVCALQSCENVENGQSYAVEIRWTAASQTMEVFFGGSLRHTYTGDLINDIFGGSPWVIPGLTAATGGATNQHTFCNFSMEGRLLPDRTIPDGTGLTATYFHNMDLTDEALTRVDPVIDFDWLGGAPDPQMDGETYSARWIGSVYAPHTGYYTFKTVTDDGVRLWIGGELLIDQWVDQGPTPHEGRIFLRAGEQAPLLMEYYENLGGAVARLSWSSIFFPEEIIPQAFLFEEGVTYLDEPPVFTLFPNPVGTDGMLHISWEGSTLQPIAVRMLDASGRIVRNERPHTRNTPFRLATTGMAPGVYMVEIVSRGFVHREKVIIP